MLINAVMQLHVTMVCLMKDGKAALLDNVITSEIQEKMIVYHYWRDLMVDVPQGFDTFQKLMGRLTDKHDLARAFDDWLEYIIMGHLTDNSMKWDKNYTKDEIKTLYEMYREFVLTMDKKLVSDKDWFDFPGTYYEACIVTPYQREKAGQFFTPANVCDLMATMTLASTEHQPGMRINDPTAGSGRCLLAAHVQRPGCFMTAEDLDHTCVLMAVVNFLIHGVMGDVIWRDSLTLNFYGAWRVNEALNSLGFPHVRSMSEEEYRAIYIESVVESSKLTEEVTIMKETKQSTLEGF